MYDKFLDGVNECCSYEKPDIEPYYQLMVEVPNDISFKETLCIIEKRLDNICVFLREMLEYVIFKLLDREKQFIFLVFAVNCILQKLGILGTR